jgi:hypothetical protein
MKAYHNNESVKQFYLDRVAAHEAADEVVQGLYWENGKGCAVGCTIHSDQHSDYPELLGVPEELARLQDAIFEGLSPERARTFPREFLTAINVGADLSKVGNRFMVWLLIDPDHGVVRYADERGADAIRAVAALHERVAEGDTVTDAAWTAARETAWTAARAAWDAAWYAAEAAARDAARAAGWAAAGAAGNAAWAARVAGTAARDAARAAGWAAARAGTAAGAAQADKLLELLRTAK